MKDQSSGSLALNVKSFWDNAYIKFKAHPVAMWSAGFIAALAILCILLPMFSHYDYKLPDYAASLEAPCSAHWFGTDGLGRDLLVRCFVGGRVTLAIAFAATATVTVIGILYGSIAGFIGGTVDAIMMRLVDVLYGIPFIFFSILLLTIFGQSIILSFVAIAAISWLDMARVVRGQTINLKHREFVDAARICGASNTRIILRHIIPNLLSVIVVYTALVVPNVIVLSAVLSFFGLGVMEPMTSWGLLISDGAQNITAWWLLLFPALLMISTLLAFTFIANGLRDALDLR